MTKPIKFGIVGLGKMGSTREKTIRENDETILISGTDPNPPTNGFKDMQFLPDYKSVINSGVDAVFVGHPKADSTPAIVDVPATRNALGIHANEVVAILPGKDVGILAASRGSLRTGAQDQ